MTPTNTPTRMTADDRPADRAAEDPVDVVQPVPKDGDRHGQGRERQGGDAQRADQRHGRRDGRLQAEREQDRRGHHGDQQPLQLLALDPPGAAGTHQERGHTQGGADGDGQAADGLEDGEEVRDALRHRGEPRCQRIEGTVVAHRPGLEDDGNAPHHHEPDDDGDRAAPAWARQGAGREDEGDGGEQQHDRGVEQQVAGEVEPVAQRVGRHRGREHVADRVAGEDPGRHRGGDREQPADRWPSARRTTTTPSAQYSHSPANRNAKKPTSTCLFVRPPSAGRGPR